MSGEGTSYQKKYDGASGTYQPLRTNESSGHTTDDLNGGRPRGRMKWILGAIVVAVIAAVFGITMPRSSPENVIKKEISSSSTLEVKENGELKLFDDTSKFLC